MSVSAVQHGRSPEALFNKAVLYVSEMESHTPEDWQMGFWASVSLELIARAALAHISPTLLADRKSWRNVYHALGHPPTAKKFVAFSIAITEVIDILQELVPEFTKELRDACVEQFGLRNAELHSGEDVFTRLGTSSWLPHYYASCDVLLRSMNKTVGDIFCDPQLAVDMISSLRDEAAKAVEKDIKSHRNGWELKDDSEREAARVQALAWATRQTGHRADCPACNSPALVRGSRQGSVATEIGQEFVIQKQTILPSSFECVACGLKIQGLSKLSAAGLGDAFTSTSTLTTAAYFGLYTEEDLDRARETWAEPEWEPDFNE